jgi:hypothetical protein
MLQVLIRCFFDPWEKTSPGSRISNPRTNFLASLKSLKKGVGSGVAQDPVVRGTYPRTAGLARYFLSVFT